VRGSFPVEPIDEWLVDEYFTSETPFVIERRLTELLKLRQIEEPMAV
jgi:hypothetical protein